MKPIIFLEPVFKETIWGGHRLREQFGYEIPSDHVGECWGVSAHPNGDCLVKEGAYKGKTLSQLWKEHQELFGYCKADRFPLLTKIIDSKGDCSVQVHPDDVYAGTYENGSLGKEECWYILDCNEDASLVVGHNARTKEELADMIHEKRWDELIRRVSVKKGDFIQIAAGTVHAITEGIMILETQQNSDVTYRVYDYDRLENGKERQLHIEQSIDVITVPAPSIEESVKSALHLPKNQLNELISCKYYKVWKLEVTKEASFEQDHPFMIISVVEGNGLIDEHPIKKGDHFILPNGYGEVKLQGEMVIIVSSIK